MFPGRIILLAPNLARPRQAAPPGARTPSARGIPRFWIRLVPFPFSPLVQLSPCFFYLVTISSLTLAPSSSRFFVLLSLVILSLFLLVIRTLVSLCFLSVPLQTSSLYFTFVPMSHNLSLLSFFVLFEIALRTRHKQQRRACPITSQVAGCSFI